jgi:serine/threonine-protein kinase
VHRDVSPQNILISTKGAAKLIDFGIAKARDRTAGETSAGQLKGKVQYMAPEQALGQPIDRRADVFALGAILYHLMAGRPAYDGENQLATLHLLTSGKPPPPLPSSVATPIAEVIKRAMCVKAEGRFDTAADMQHALEKAMVEANLATSTVEVAAFTQKHMGDRAEARRKAVELALQAGAERARMNELLRTSSESFDTPSGHWPVGEKSDPARELVSPFDIAPSQESSTLGISGVMTPAPEGPAPPVKRRKTFISLVVGSAIGIAALIVIAAAVSAVRRPREDRANAGRAPLTATAVQREPEAIPPPTLDAIPTTTPAPEATVAVRPAPAPRPVVRAHGHPAAATKTTGKSAKSPSSPDDGF